jgi:hypothetical protein
MKIKVRHSILGDCTLTDEHPRCRLGLPLLVGPDQRVYGPRDADVLAGSLHPEAGPGYSREYLAFVRKFNSGIAY